MSAGTCWELEVKTQDNPCLQMCAGTATACVGHSRTPVVPLTTRDLSGFQALRGDLRSCFAASIIHRSSEHQLPVFPHEGDPVTITV